ncbi:MAG: PilZ domain-containing protein [Planctomycetota bacterium]
MGSERRREKRIPTRECFVECTSISFWNFLKKPTPETYPLVDISKGGCHLLATSGMALALSVRLHLMVPKDPKPVEVLGSVAWCKRSSAKNRDEIFFSIGIRFVKFPAKERERFEMLLLTKRFDKPTGAASKIVPAEALASKAR